MPKPNIQLAASEIISLPQPPLRKAEDYLKAYQGYPYSAISSIADEVTSIELHLFKRKILNGKVTADEILENEALSLLHYVNPFMTSYDLKISTQVYLELVGEAFWVVFREKGEKGKPLELWPLRPDWIKVKPSETEVVDSYIYNPGGNMTKEILFKRSNIIHFKYFNPLNPYRGKGSIQAAAMPIDIHDFASEWNRNFFFNSATPGLVFLTEQKMAPETLTRFAESWKQKYGGRDKSHKVAFLSGGFKLDKTSMSAKDMDFKSLQTLMRDDMLAVFKVPKTVLGLTDDVNRANAEATTRAFMERVITPRMKKFVAHLNEFYLPMFEQDIFFDFDDPAPEDTEQKLSIYNSGLGATGGLPWLTINEVREQENLPAVEGGDVIYIGFGRMPIGSTLPVPPQKPGEKPTDQGKGLFGIFKRQEQHELLQTMITLKVKGIPFKKARKFMMPIPPKRVEEIRDEALKNEIRLDIVKLVTNLMTNNQKKNKKTKSTWSLEKRENYWRQMVSITDVLEDKMKIIFVPLFDDQESEVKQKLNDLKDFHPARIKGKASSFLFDKKFENQKWDRIITPFIRDVVVQAGAETLDFLGIGGQLDLIAEKAVKETVIEFIKNNSFEIIEGINETTLLKLKKQLEEGFEAGEGIDKLKSRVSSVFVEARGPRAEKIARTEILRATNFGTLEAYKQSKIVKGKEWLTAVDERVCPWCASMDGKIIDIEEEYFEKGDELTVDGKTLKFDYLDVLHPPLHVSCRCTLIPVVL